MRLKEVNYFGFDHKVVNENFGGELTYIRTFSIRGYHWAVYKAANPDREKGHKDYMMLCTSPTGVGGVGGHVSGSTPEQMEAERYQEGVLCTGCDTVIYSINRHHFHKCGCKLEAFVDGGKDYLRRGGYSMESQDIVKIDLITGELVERNGIPCEPRVKLETYAPSSEKPKKRLTARRKSGKVEESNPRSKK